MDLFDAIRDSNFDKLREILETGLCVNSVKDDELGLHPLMFATSLDKSYALQMLLCYGGNVNLRSNSGRSVAPLHKACEKGFEEAAHILLTHGACSDVQDDDGFTPLHYASTFGFPKIIHFLLLYKADINATAKNGNSALHIAAYYGRKECAKILLGYDINHTIKNIQGKDAISFAADKKHEDISILITALASATVSCNKTEEMKGVQTLDEQISELQQKKISLLLSNKLKFVDNHTNHIEALSKSLSESKQNISLLQIKLVEIKDKFAEDVEALVQSTKEKMAVDNEIILLKNSLHFMKANSSNGETYECPICMEIPLPPRLVYQCTNGHIYCSECREKPNMNICPQCKEDIKDLAIRCRIMEDLVLCKYDFSVTS